jgi:hypothetical protein
MYIEISFARCQVFESRLTEVNCQGRSNCLFLTSLPDVTRLYLQRRVEYRRRGINDGILPVNSASAARLAYKYNCSHQNLWSTVIGVSQKLTQQYILIDLNDFWPTCETTCRQPQYKTSMHEHDEVGRQLQMHDVYQRLKVKI